jgi:hypothetical protein
MTYLEKKAHANAYLARVSSLSWDELADINSLHDVEAEEDIESLCDDRLEESGFPISDLIPD